MEYDRQTEVGSYPELTAKGLDLGLAGGIGQRIIKPDLADGHGVPCKPFQICKQLLIALASVHGMQAEGRIYPSHFPSQGGNSVPASRANARDKEFPHPCLSGSGKDFRKPAQEARIIEVTMGVDEHALENLEYDVNNCQSTVSFCREKREAVYGCLFRHIFIALLAPKM
jgi:hypothetical protein